MGTLGQKLKANYEAGRPASTVVDYAAQEAARLQKLVESLSNVIEQAKKDFAAAIEAKKNAFRIESKVREDVEATREVYDFLRRVRNERAYGPTDELLLLSWNHFLAWAASEDLRIELAQCLPDVVNGERRGGFYMLISARPIDSPV